MSEENRDNIRPFNTDGEYFMRAARKAMDEGKLVESLHLLRDGEKHFPHAAGDFRIAQANVLNRMQRFEHSLRLLLTTAPLEELPEEGFFGVADNFMAMEEFGAAHVCLELYVKHWPQGMYFQNCRDMLLLLHNGEEMSWQLGLEEGEDPDLITHLHIARAMHFSMQDEQSLNYLLGVEAKYPRSLWLQMEIALDQFCIGDYAGAEQRVFNILKKDRGYIRARCLLALIRLSEHKPREAREMMDSIPIPDDGTTEELGNLCAMLLEVEDYERAEKCAALLLEQLPYDSLSLHEAAFAKAMLGKWEEAYTLYENILSIDPEDTVADYYLTMVDMYGGKKQDMEQLRRCFTTNYDVPYDEAISRFNEIKRYLKRSAAEMQKAWAENKRLQYLVRWALYSPLFQAKKLLFALLGKLGDWRAHYLLTDFLLRMDQSDQDKQLAIAALKDMGDNGPYSLYFEGGWRYGMVKTLTLPADMPAGYQDLFEELTGIELAYGLPEGAEDVARRLFYHYVQALKGDYPRMNREQRQAMLAALSIMALHVITKKDYDTEELADRFGVSLRRLQNALNRLLVAAEDFDENGEEDPS